MVTTIEDAHLAGFIWCLIIESFQGTVQHVNRLEANNKRNSVCKSALKWIILVTLENIFFHKLGYLSLYGFRIDRNQFSYYVPLHGICWKQCLEFNLLTWIHCERHRDLEPDLCYLFRSSLAVDFILVAKIKNSKNLIANWDVWSDAIYNREYS